MASLKITKKHHKHLNNPFPSNPKTLPCIHGNLLFDFQSVPSEQIYNIGKDFQSNWSSKNGGSLCIFHKSQPSRSMWSTVPGRSFVSAAVAETEIEESRGSFVIKDRDIHSICNHQTIDNIRTIHTSDIVLCANNQDFTSFSNGLDQERQNKGIQLPALLITGKIFCVKKRKNSIQSFEFIEKQQSTYAKYWMLFDQKNKNQIGFQVRLAKPKVEHRQKLSPRTYGYRAFISKFGRIRRLRVGCSRYFSRKRGIITVSPAEEENVIMKNEGVTDFNRICITYSSEKSEKFYGFGEQFSHMDFKGKRVPIFVQEQGIGRGDQPITFAANLVSYRWRPQKLPDWIISGAVVGLQGGTETVRHMWKELQAQETPVSAFWLQDWVGQRKTVIGSQLWWNWEVDSNRYSGWRQLIKDLGARDIKVMTYCNPCLALMDEKPNAKRNLFEEATKLDILVKEKNGDPYMVPNTAFDVGMLDLTHPKTESWFKQILQEMVDDGVRGWMADFGEGLPVDACLYSGEDPITAHNRYPELWAKINREFVEEWKSSLVGKEKEDPEDGLVFFMRAGFRNSPKWATLFWEGDQMVSWQANDGIKSAVVGLLSSGLSGYALNHSDIGGYCSVNLPFFKYQRSEELLLRWMELNAFSVVFRTHEGNKPTSNSQFYSNHRTLSHFARFAKIYKAWKFYRIQLVKVI
ncbi:alpha-xylosidase 2 [Olea europaea subsp. europaea]|uniref:Alpha-xylosidase 2 n=1 Tax=Olea europaea subsp. europaea TaxID=158383 RepID=A0A8S0R1S6_OLEEU|nr:alpha-xylosidase 2 [Olea europaea subsp. europaea]